MEDDERRRERQLRWDREDGLRAQDRQPICAVELLKRRPPGPDVIVPYSNQDVIVQCINLGTTMFYVEKLRLQVGGTCLIKSVDGPKVLMPGISALFTLSCADFWDADQKQGEVVAITKSSNGQYESKGELFYFWKDDDGNLEFRLGVSMVGAVVQYPREIDA